MHSRLTPFVAVALIALCAPLAAQTGAASNPASTPEQKLTALGLTLPATSNPVANYVPAVRSGNLVFLAGHVSRSPDGKVIAGKVPRDISEKDANAAAKQTALALLATLKQEIGDLSKVKRIVRVSGYVNATDNFTAHSQVINGCSDLLVAIFGDKGRHARAALGMASLPLGCAVEIDMIVELE